MSDSQAFIGRQRYGSQDTDENGDEDGRGGNDLGKLNPPYVGRKGTDRRETRTMTLEKEWHEPSRPTFWHGGGCTP